MPLIRKPPPGPPSAPAQAPDLAAVLRALATGGDDERWQAARAAAEWPDAASALGEALARERVPAVREALFSALARIATPAAIETVLPFLRCDDSSLRTQASDALAAMGEPAWPYLAALVRDENTDVRILACGLVRGMPQHAGVKLCCEVLDAEPEPNVCAAVVEVLAELGDSSAISALERCAARFAETPFLAFSIKIAIDRARSQVSRA